MSNPDILQFLPAPGAIPQPLLGTRPDSTKFGSSAKQDGNA